MSTVAVNITVRVGELAAILAAELMAYAARRRLTSGQLCVPNVLRSLVRSGGHMSSSEGVTVIHMPVKVTELQAPILFAIPMQLLAYHVAVLKGTDVDQPRNLAKSLTVE